MAKIFIKGYPEPIDVSSDAAERIATLMADSSRQKDTIDVGNVTVQIKEIKFLKKDTEARTERFYDLDNPTEKDKVLELERALKRFDHLRPWQWEHYCISKGYFLKPKFSALHKKPEDYSINSSKSTDLYEDELKYKALRDLKMRRWYAKKSEHNSQLASFGFTECPDKPGTEKRCELCYPKTIQEFREELIEQFKTKQMVDTNIGSDTI